MTLIAASVLIAVPIAAAAASPMSAGEFLSRAEPLMKKSKAALIFSSEARTLMRTLGETAQRNRERLEAERAAGRPPTTCLPPKGKAQVNAAELLNHIRAMPSAEKARSFDSAFAGFIAKKYPCRA